MSMAGIVVIGRNEGERLRRSLESVVRRGRPVVYVDSASADGSSALARSMDCEVVEVDPSRPLSAARARNEGFERLLQIQPDAEAVQFVDGDCALAAGWMERALEVLGGRRDVAVVYGRLRELHRGASVYNRLCDLEWDLPAGEVTVGGGIALVRASAFLQAGGFNPSLVASEEPELSVRLLDAGWKILRIDAEMASHDAAMTRFGQWWKRRVRVGYGYAHSSRLSRGRPHRYGVRENLSILSWALLWPALAAGLLWPTGGWSLLMLAAYPLLVLRIVRYRRRRGDARGDAWLYALFCILGKWPEFAGQARFLADRLRGAVPAVFEYKAVGGLRPGAPAGPVATGAEGGTGAAPARRE